MKVKNNNKEVIKKITRRSLKENRVNNLFAILAIILTTFMISTIFTVGISMKQNHDQMECRMQGSMANVILNAPTEEQLNAFKNSDKIESSGTMTILGSVVDKELTDNGKDVELYVYDKQVYEKQVRPCIDRIEGNYPEKENEIMVSRMSLDFMKKTGVKVGDSISLRLKLPEGEKEKEFVVSGMYSEFGFNMDSSHIIASEAFLKEQQGVRPEDITAQIDLASDYTEESEETMKAIAPLGNGQEYSCLFDIERENKTDNSVMIIAILIMVAFIMFSGYLFIYNILFIAVKKNIQFYGLLKTIGTSPKQIKKIVRGQIYRLAGIGIPIGMVLGFTSSFIILPQVVRTMSSDIYSSAMPTTISFHPSVFIGACLFSFLTIALSVKKPASVASKIAPTEALHYSGIEEVKKGQRSGLHGGKLYKLAWHNVFREKKRAVIVFLSLFMGITTFLMVKGFLDGMKIENYVNAYLPYDFEVIQTQSDTKKMNPETMQQIATMEGAKEVRIKKESLQVLSSKETFIDSVIKETLRSQGNTEEECKLAKQELLTGPEEIECNVYGINEKCVEEYNKKAVKKIDLDEFKEGKTILVYPERFGRKQVLDESKIIGDALTLKDPTTKKETVFTPVLLEKDHVGIPDTYLSMMGVPTIYMSLDAMDKIDPSAAIQYVSFNVDPKDEDAIKTSLEQTAKEKFLQVDAKSTRIKEFNDGTKTMYLISGGVSFILILIGVLNFINVMITGVYVRFKELAVMESIGMTKKQIKKMLMLEGIYYAGVTSVLVGTIGMLCVRGVAQLELKICDYAVIAMPWLSFFILLAIVLGICMITPILVYRIASKQTITERLRTE